VNWRSRESRRSQRRSKKWRGEEPSFPFSIKSKKGDIVKVAITSQGDNLNTQVDTRFGRCAYFIIVDLGARTIEAVTNPASGAMGGAGPQAAQTIANKGVKAVITGNIGPNAFQTLKAANIKIYQGASGTVKETLTKYEIGELKELSNSSVSDHFGVRQGERKIE
jgi:predicted Fe-Mo cluster-binding NifX family protein